MCRTCFDALSKYFPLDDPNDPASEGMYALWNETAFPFSDGDETAKALQAVRFRLDNYRLLPKQETP